MLQPQARRRFATVAGLTVTALALVAIGVITLSPAVVTVVLPFWCMRCGARPAIDVLLNVLMFVPLGVGLALLRVRGQVAALAIVLATCAIEATQYGIVAGRFASARDILTNSAGGLAGWYLWSRWRSFAIPPARTARRLGLATAVLWISTQAITAWAHRVVAPTRARSPRR